MWLHFLTEAIYAFWGLYVKRKIPVIIYAPGRVGSMALHYELRRAGVFSFKVEKMFMSRRGSTKFAKKHILDRREPVKIISIVRDPMEMLITYYFSLFKILPHAKAAADEKDIHELTNIFITECIKNTKRFNNHVRWFETEFEPVLNINIFDHEFNQQKKYILFTKDNKSILIYRLDLADKKKKDIVNEFLDTNISIVRANSRAEKNYADVYTLFKNNLNMPAVLVNEIYNTPYAQHFFSTTELAKMRGRWS